MKHFIKIILVFHIVILFSCEKTSPEEPVEAQIVQHTCGGTVINFTSVDFGEEWVNFFDDSQNYDNVALTSDVNAQNFQEGDVIVFSFKEIKQLRGNTCDIGGLPETKVELHDIKLIE